MPNPFYSVVDNSDTVFASDIDQFSDAFRGANDVGTITFFAPLSAPAAPTVAVNATAGNLTGAYLYKIAFITGYWKGQVGTGTLTTQGNTSGGTASASVSPSAQQVNLTAIPVGPTGTVARMIYRTKAGGSTYYQVAQINDNTTTSYSDNTADTSLTVVMPASNTTGTGLTIGSFSVSASGVPTGPTAVAGTNTTQLATTAFVQTEQANDLATATPLMDGTAAVGTATKKAREDHKHPTDTSRAPLASPTFTGVPAAPTAAVNTNTTQLATTAFVLAQAGTATPTMSSGTGAVGTATKFAREDHVHPDDTSKANVASPTFTGVPAAPTASAGTNTTQIATTAFVSTAIVNKVDAGTTNADSDLLYSLLVDVDTRSASVTRDVTSGKISQIDVKNGATVVQSYAITRGTDGKIDSIVQTAAGKTITYTITRDANRKFSSYSKTVA